MKHIVPILILALFISSLATSCSKMSDNGPIDGMWHLEKIYTRPDGNASGPYSVEKDCGEDRIYWSFQLDLLSIRSKEGHNGKTNESVARFKLTSSTLDITSLYVHYRDRDSLLTDPATVDLSSVGIHGVNPSYTIVQLDGKHMRLCSATDSLIFRKL